MINLPDWIIAHKIVRKSKKQFAYRVFFTLGRYPFTAAYLNTLCAILFECGAVHVCASGHATGTGCSGEAHFARGLNCHALKQQLGGIVNCRLHVTKDTFLGNHYSDARDWFNAKNKEILGS